MLCYRTDEKSVLRYLSRCSPQYKPEQVKQQYHCCYHLYCLYMLICFSVHGVENYLRMISILRLGSNCTPSTQSRPTVILIMSPSFVRFNISFNPSTVRSIDACGHGAKLAFATVRGKMFVTSWIFSIFSIMNSPSNVLTIAQTDNLQK